VNGALLLIQGSYQPDYFQAGSAVMEKKKIGTLNRLRDIFIKYQAIKRLGSQPDMIPQMEYAFI